MKPIEECTDEELQQYLMQVSDIKATSELMCKQLEKDNPALITQFLRTFKEVYGYANGGHELSLYTLEAYMLRAFGVPMFLSLNLVILSTKVSGIVYGTVEALRAQKTKKH